MVVCFGILAISVSRLSTEIVFFFSFCKLCLCVRVWCLSIFLCDEYKFIKNTYTFNFIFVRCVRGSKIQSCLNCLRRIYDVIQSKQNSRCVFILYDYIIIFPEPLKERNWQIWPIFCIIRCVNKLIEWACLHLLWKYILYWRVIHLLLSFSIEYSQKNLLDENT